MILFLTPGQQKLLFDRRAAGKLRLRLVQGLRAYLADMVDPHQACAVATLRIIQITIRDFCRRVSAASNGHATHHAQGAVEMPDQTIRKLHMYTYSKQMLHENDIQLHIKCVFCKMLTHIKKS